jgi:hypothetical protein
VEFPQNDAYMRLRFDFHGVRVSVESDCAPLLERLEGDFGHFLDAREGGRADDVRARFVQDDPPWHETGPGARRLFRTPNNTVYRVGRLRHVDHHGRALTVFDRGRDEAVAYAASEGDLHEVAYLFLLSRVGHRLDRIGYHRLHALAVAVDDRALVFLGDSGCGKTTLGLAMMRRPEVRWLSDEIPLLHPDGRIVAFPMPPRLTRGAPIPWPPEPVPLREVSRSKQPPKVAVDRGVLEGRVCASARPGAVFVCRRSRDPDRPAIRRVGPGAAIHGLFRNALHGRDFPQTKAYFLGFTPRFAWQMASVLLDRARALVRLARSTPVYGFEMARDIGSNLEAVRETLERDPDPGVRFPSADGGAPLAAASSREEAP